MTKIIVKCLNVDLTEALNAHVQEQVGKVVDHFESVVVEDIHVSLNVDTHHKHLNTVTIKIPVRGNDIVVEDGGADMYQLITSTASKASRAVRKVKEKSQSHKGKDKRTMADDEELGADE